MCVRVGWGGGRMAVPGTQPGVHVELEEPLAVPKKQNITSKLSAIDLEGTCTTIGL